MTLGELLATLETDIVVKVADSDNDEIIKFYANGAAALDDALIGRTVRKVKITASMISVLLNSAE